MPKGHGRGQASRAKVTGVDGRGRYGKESIGIASWKRDEPMRRARRAAGPRSL